MRKYVVIGVILIIGFLILGGLFKQQHALSCELLPNLNYKPLTNEIYLAPEISDEVAQQINDMIRSAIERIHDVYGTPKLQPRILILSDPQMAAKWGANETASMHRLPWRSCIVIGPKGQNVDVIAHELIHAEIMHRVGFFRFMKEIPVWFDEGAALTLDYREPFLPENIRLSDAEIESVKALSSGRAFFSGDIHKNYQAARLTVEPLINADTFFDDLDQISAGASFNSVFLKAID